MKTLDYFEKLSDFQQYLYLVSWAIPSHFHRSFLFVVDHLGDTPVIVDYCRRMTCFDKFACVLDVFGIVVDLDRGFVYFKSNKF